MNRQLYANGGIMQVAPREKFGLGSSIKKFVRKIIPNEVADIAVKAAPFVAPFNPAVAAAMAGIGSFDQTGSIGDSLKRGALTYGGGQAARYIGGAGFQGNPFGDGGAFTGGLQGFKGGFSSPIGADTGLGKFFSNRGTEGVQGISVDSGRAGDSASALSRSTANAPTEIIPTNLNDYAGTEIIPTNLNDYAGTATNALVDASDMSLVGDVKQAASQEFNLFKAAADKVKNFDYREAGNKALELGKKFGKAIYTDKDGNLDKAALLGTIAFAGSYAEAKALAADAGVEITPEEYDEATKEDKKAEYASYLTNFFGGQKDGGRIGFKLGTPKDTTMFEELNVDTIYRPKPESTITLPEEMPGDDKMAGSQGYDEQYNAFIELRDTFYYREGDSYSEANRKAKQIVYGMKEGGRIGFKLGSKPEDAEVGIMTIDVEAGNDDEDEEDMMMAYEPGSFTSAQKNYMFRRLAAMGGKDRSITMPDLYKIFKNPGKYPADELVIKSILEANGLKDGGRIGFAFGSPDRKTDIEEELSVDTIYRPTDKPPMLEEMPGGDKMVDIDYTPSFIKDFDKDLDKLSFSKFNKPYVELEILEKEFILEVMKNIGNTVFKADGGRIGYKYGSGASNRVAQLILERDYLLSKDEDVSYIDAELESLGYKMKAEGGIMEAKVPTGQMRKNNAGVAERDYRQTGGFVPVGIKERADDVPAMLSKNEFVMTADAVRGIGNGSVEEGSKKLYNTMKQAEKVGKA